MDTFEFMYICAFILIHFALYSCYCRLINNMGIKTFAIQREGAKKKIFIDHLVRKMPVS